MKKIKFVILLTLCILFNFQSLCAENTKTIYAGMNIPIVFSETISSENLQAGQTVNIEIADDIVFGNKVFFKKGDKGYLQIEKVLTKRKFGKAGLIKFGGTKYGEKKITNALIAPFSITIPGKSYFDGYIIDNNGNFIPIGFDKEFKGKKNKFINVFAHVMVWNPIGWGLLWIKGKDVVIEQNYNDTVILLQNITR